MNDWIRRLGQLKVLQSHGKLSGGGHDGGRTKRRDCKKKIQSLEEKSRYLDSTEGSRKKKILLRGQVENEGLN